MPANFIEFAAAFALGFGPLNKYGVVFKRWHRAGEDTPEEDQDWEFDVPASESLRFRMLAHAYKLEIVQERTVRYRGETWALFYIPSDQFYGLPEEVTHG